MTPISIRERFSLFSHDPGVETLVPGTSVALKVFPSVIFWEDLESGVKQKVELPVEGPVEKMNLIVDLERGWVTLLGKDKKGFFRFRIVREEKTILLSGRDWSFRFTPALIFSVPSADERLSLGAVPKQPWENVVRKGELRQLLPPLYRFLTWYPHSDVKTDDLLGELSFLVESVDRLRIGPALLLLVKGGFRGIFRPQVEDSFHLGLEKSLEANKKPILFLSRLKSIISFLFVHKWPGQATLLPALPRELPAGRVKGILLSDGMFADLEWRKGKARKVQVRGEGLLDLSVFEAVSSRKGKEQEVFPVPLSMKRDRVCFDRFAHQSKALG